jgi:hypothetical protein
LIDTALLERFGAPLTFDSWAGLAEAGAKRVVAIWAAESDGAPLPFQAKDWGWHKSGGKPHRYSLRTALDALQQALLELPEPAGVAA